MALRHGVRHGLADFVYEGARSITGPLLASLGATGLVVGVVTGIGEAAALGLRLVSGPLADRTQRFWAWTIAGYTLTIVTVPVLGIAAALWVASALVIAERVGNAVRSPAKDTLTDNAMPAFACPKSTSVVAVNMSTVPIPAMSSAGLIRIRIRCPMTGGKRRPTAHWTESRAATKSHPDSISFDAIVDGSRTEWPT